jgi:hypothetical protein
VLQRDKKYAFFADNGMGCNTSLDLHVARQSSSRYGPISMISIDLFLFNKLSSFRSLFVSLSFCIVIAITICDEAPNPKA